MPHPRSYILLPGHDPGALETGQRSKADLFVFDFEDMVPEADKAKARLRVRTWLEMEDLPGQSVAVRFNAWQSGAGRIDLTALAGMNLGHVLIPKIETVADIEHTKAVLAEAGLGAPALHVIIETPDAVQALDEIAATEPASLIVGAFDLAKELGVDPDPNTTEIFKARQQVAEAAKRAGIASFDMPYINQTDLAGFDEHVVQAKYLGFTGCCAMNGNQAVRINAVFEDPGE